MTTEINPTASMLPTAGEGTSAAGELTVTVDHMSPYYLHPSDNLTQPYLADILRDGNYGDWVTEITNVLYAKNKIGFVDGSIPLPPPNSPYHALWKRCNAMVRIWLNSAMDKEIRNSVKHAKTAKEVWDDLAERFGKESAPRAYELKRSLTLTRQDKQSVSAYYTKLRSIWEEIESALATPKCTCGGCSCGGCSCDVQKQYYSVRKKERLYEFLMGLDDAFSVIRTQTL